MKRGALIFFLILIYSYNVSALELNLDLSTRSYGLNQSFQGNLSINLGQNVSSSSILRGLVNNNEFSNINIAEFFNLNGLNYSVLNRNYQVNGNGFESGPFLINETTLWGFSIPSSLSTLNQFYINFTATNAILKIDVGNDNNFEWMSKGIVIGYENEKFPIGVNENTTADSSIDLRGNDIYCEDINLDLNELYDYTEVILYTRAKKISSGGDLYLKLDNEECNIPENNLDNINFKLISCLVNVTNIRDGNYRLCAFSKTGNAGTVYYELPKKFGTISNYYFLTLRPAKYSNTVNGFVSINNEKIRNSFTNYLNSCSEDLCIIPIAFYSNRSSSINIQNILIKLDLVNRFTRLYNLNSAGDSIIYNGIANLDLSKVNKLRTPNVRGNFSLKFQMNNIYSNSIDFIVKELPIARIKVNSLSLGVNEVFVFDARQSNSTLGNITNYTWHFGDNITRYGLLVNYSFSRIGNYSISLVVSDSSGAVSNPEIIDVKVVAYSMSLGSYINDTRTILEETERYFANSSIELFEYYEILGFRSILETSKNNLDRLNNEYNSLISNNITNQSNYDVIYQSVKDIRNALPRDISSDLIEENIYPLREDINEHIVDKYSSDSVNEVYNYNGQLQENNKISLVDVTYLEGASDTFIVVKKKLAFSGDYIVVEDLSLVLDSVELVNIVNDDYKLDKENIAILFEGLETNEISYYFKASDISKYGKTFLLRKNKTQPVEEESVCGDNICSKDENEISCSHDCEKVKINWFLYSLIVGVILLLYYLFFTNAPGNLRKYFNITTSDKKETKLFVSNQDFYNLRKYVDQSLSRGLRKDKVVLVLLKQGWTKEQIDFAFKNKKV